VDDLRNLNFTWTFVNLTETGMVLQLDFEDPNMVGNQGHIYDLL